MWSGTLQASLLLLLLAVGLQEIFGAPAVKDEEPWLRAKRRFNFYRAKLITIGGPSWSKRAAPAQAPNSEIEDDGKVASHDLIIDDTLPPGRFNLSKRFSDHKHFGVMDILIVLDFRIFLSYLQKYQSPNEAKLHIKEYYEHFVGYVSEIFEKAANSFAITIKPVAIVVSTDIYASPWAEEGLVRNPAESLPAKRALQTFDRWLSKHQSKFPKFDHAMAVTKTNLFDVSIDDSLRGMAWVSQMCKKVTAGKVGSTSIITDKGAFQGVLTAAHEIGHSLGAPHDGNAKYASWCKETDRYLMSPILPMSPDVARFSACSEFVIKHNFRVRKYPCLMKSEHVHGMSTMHRHPGSKFDANELCRQWFGKTYEACHLLSTTDLYGTMCSDMLICGIRDSEEMCSRQDTVPAGTPCGSKRVCRENRCVPDHHAPCCPLKTEDHDYCSRKMRESDDNCKNPNMKFLCCRHCGITC